MTSTFSQEAWAGIADVRAAIDDLPFLRELLDGSLPEATFREYMTQDALYLARYAKALAAAAAASPTTDALVFWAERARDSIVVERELHAARITDVDGFDADAMSPVCTAYTSFLLSLAGEGYPVLVAGLLPCFWIYDDVGTRLRGRVDDLAAHPFGDWIGTYGDPVFAAQTREAIAFVDGAADAASPQVRERMRAAFTRAAQYEWMFWDSAYRRQGWPVG